MQTASPTIYDANKLLALIDAHPFALIAGLGIAMLFQTVWLVAAVRVAQRDQAYSLPLACTFVWFAHDLGFVVRFSHWSDAYGHWFLYLFWVGMLSATLLEVVFFAQIMRYGRLEIAPHLSTWQFRATIVAAAAGVVVAWEYLKSIVDDPLCLGSSALTLLSFALFGPALYVKRAGPRGQNLVMWLSFTAMTFTWWLTTATFLTPAFRSPQYIAVGAFSFLVGVVMVVVLLRERSSRRSHTGLAPRSPDRVTASRPGNLPG